jgi:hypothetical protein
MAQRSGSGGKSGSSGSGNSRSRKSGSGKSRSSGSGKSRSSGSGKSSSGSSGSRKSGSGNSERRERRILGTAPSAPDIRKLKLMEPSEEAKAHVPSDVDAMGHDKRRQVVGHSYGPSRRSQIMFFVAVGAVAFVLIGGWITLVSIFDQTPDHFPDKAPWSESTGTPEQRAEQATPPAAVDTPCGEPGNVYPVPAESPCVKPAPAATAGINSSSK